MEYPGLPQRWSKWKILELLGEGSYGTVYKAQRMIGTDAVYNAIKIIHVPGEDCEMREVFKMLGTEDSVRAYYRDVVDNYIGEIKAMEQLKGITNIVTIQDYEVETVTDKVGWIIYIRMEYLNSFSEYQRNHPIGEEEVLQIGIDLCTALEYCEKVKIIHRDIKTENIFVSDLGSFKLGDFGISRKMDRSLSVHSTRGTYSYMAPEVYRGEKYDNRADIYSLGLVLYRLLNRNREPFLPMNQQMVYYKDREAALNFRMSGATPEAPVECSKGLWKILSKAISFQPDDRFFSAKEFKSALMCIQQNEESSGKEKTEKKRVLIKTAALLIALLTIVIPVTKFGGEKKRERTETEAVAETELIVSTEITKEQETVAETETENVTVTEMEAVKETETVSERKKTEMTMDKQQINITEYAGFVISKKGKLSQYYNLSELEKKLQEGGLLEDGYMLKQLIDTFDDQFRVDKDLKDAEVGDIISMEYKPTDEYLELLKEAGVQFKYNKKSKAYQGMGE